MSGPGFGPSSQQPDINASPNRFGSPIRDFNGPQGSQLPESTIPANKPQENQNQQEENKNQQEQQNKEQYEEEKFIDVSELVEIKKSSYMSPLEVALSQAKYIKPLKTKGFLGTKAIVINKDKAISQPIGVGDPDPVLDRVYAEDKDVDHELLEKDGIHVEGDTISFVNVQRDEQRLCWEGRKDYFRADNKKLIMDNELYEEKITTMRDLSIAPNPNLSLIKKNAYLSERQNQKKNEYYKLDVNIGELQFKRYPLFIEEDRKVMLLKDKVREYKEKVDVAIIPHLIRQREQLIIEKDKLLMMRDPPKDLYLIDQEITHIEDEIRKEKDYINSLANEIYATWGSIKETRQKQDFASTEVRLNVNEYNSDAGLKEYDFFLSLGEHSKKTFKNANLPRSETGRRSRIQSTKCYLKIYINDNYAAKTKKVQIQWPSFEVPFNEKFQIYLYTKPASIRFDVILGTLREHVVDSVYVDIPGDNANSLTSSSTIFREAAFEKKVVASKKKIPKPKAPKEDKKNKNKDKENKPGDPSQPQQQIPQQQQQPEQNKNKPAEKKQDGTELVEEDEYIITYKRPYGGVITFKAEWFGFGPKLPPPSIEKFAIAQKDGIKQKHQHIKEGESLDKMIDLNDPRNEYLIQDLKDIKNAQIQALLDQDAMMPLIDVPSFRHKLLKLRFQKAHLINKKIPLTEEEVINNRELMGYLVEYEKEIRKFIHDHDYEGGPMLVGDISKVELMIPESKQVKDRKKDFKRRLFYRQQEAQRMKNKEIASNLPLKAIVHEYRFEEGINPLKELFRDMFAQRGKLKPKKKPQEKVAAQQAKKTEILIHVVKGLNVPIRAAQVDVLKAIQVGGMQPQFGGSRMGFGMNMRQSNFPMNQSGYGTQNPMQLGMYGNNPNQMGMSGGGFNPGGQPQDPNNPNNMMGGSQMPGGGMNRQYDRNDEQLMMRSQITRPAMQTGYLSEMQDIERVMSFIQVQLYDPDTGRIEIEKTETFEGSSPEWNNNLTILFNALSEKGFNINELKRSRSILFFTLFDLVGTVKRESQTSNKISVIIEKRYLGSLTIPMLTIFQNPKMDATFKMERPIFLFGYKNIRGNIFGDDNDRNSMDLNLNPLTPTYLTLSLSLNPVLEIPSRNSAEYIGGGEDPQLLMKGAKFIQVLRKKKYLANRNIKLWAEMLDKEGKIVSKFISRFLSSDIEPPLHPQDDDKIYLKCARYVSLIPFKSDTEFFKDLPDLWSPCQEFLDLRAGDYEEHAILLCNYFLYLDKKNNRQNVKTYLVLGYGIPEGDTSYVMRRNTTTNDVEIWNPVTGEPYFFKKALDFIPCCGLKLGKKERIDKVVSDVNCPLQQIGCVIDEKNVWINLQQESSPGNIDWNVENVKKWKPFLTDKNRYQFFNEGVPKSIQGVISHESPDNDDYLDYVNKLQKRIESEIAKRIEQIRIAPIHKDKGAYRTRWDRPTSDRIRHALMRELEPYKYQTRMTGNNSNLFDATYDARKAQENIQRSQEQLENLRVGIINALPTGSDIYGFPINLTYTDIDRVWMEVKNTDIHNIQSDLVQYVLAVHIDPYPHYIMSVWIFIGVLFDMPVK